MDSTVDIWGRRVPFRVEDRSGSLRPSSTAEVAILITQALVDVIHFPLATTIRAIVLVATRTITEISIELQDQRVIKRIQLRDVTARRFNDYLTSLSADYSWDPEIKAMLRASVMDDLKKELSRLIYR